MFKKGCPDVLCEDCHKNCEFKKIMKQANRGLDFDKIAEEIEKDIKGQKEEIKQEQRVKELEEENSKANKIISELCSTIRFLNSNGNTKLTNVDVFLEDAEDFIK